MKAVYVFLLALLIVLSSSCKKDKLDGDKEELIGTWKWVHSRKVGLTGQFYSDFIAPSSKGYDFELVFKERGIMRAYKDGVCEERNRLICKSEGVSPGFGLSFIFELNKREENIHIILREGDTLTQKMFPLYTEGTVLSGGGYLNYFVRE